MNTISAQRVTTCAFILWVHDTPKYCHNPLLEVMEFIDRTISYTFPYETSMLNEEDIKLQRHKHTHTCYKKKVVSTQ